jgi:hypothetical protein
MASDNDPTKLQKELDEARALLLAFQTQGTTIKRSAKGGVSVYGINRYPVTLYRSQWLKLLSMAPSILAFIEEHAADLPLKNE